MASVGRIASGRVPWPGMYHRVLRPPTIAVGLVPAIPKASSSRFSMLDLC